MSRSLDRARRLLIASQAVFFLCVSACVVIAHGPAAQANGISYFGVHAPTLPLIIVGYGVASVGFWRASGLLLGIEDAGVTIAVLRVVAVGLPLELLTPFNHGAFFNWAHMGIGVVIGASQMAASADLARREHRRRVTLAALVQLAGGIVCALALPDWHLNHMLQGEIVFEVGYAWCLVQWVHNRVPRSASTTHAVRGDASTK